jgi:glycosyltransferase involved in cell wall biosynthesis
MRNRHELTTPGVAPDRRRIALVLWNGKIGGAETFTAALARALRDLGADARVVFLSAPSRLARRLLETGVPFESLELPRGRSLVLHPRRFARVTRQAGVDGAILPYGSYLAAALRLGGYPGRIVAVEHGSVLQSRRKRHPERALRWAVDVRVGVSDYVSAALPRPERVVTIPNAVDLDRYRQAAQAAEDGHARRGPVIGCMARLVPGKGVDDALAAAAGELADGGRMRIAGDGPERSRLEALARRLGVERRVDFLGWVDDPAAFWASCDVAVVPSHQWIESFGLAAVEAMACGRPVIATRNGGLAELVADGETGFLVPPGDLGALGGALRAYRDPALRAAHGAAARLRCEARFDIRRCARAYLTLVEERSVS